MTRRYRRFGPVEAAVLSLSGLVPAIAYAQNTVYFSTSDAGQTKSIAQWGVEVAWLNSDNMRLSIANMGASNINAIATNFYVDEPLQADGTLGPNSRSRIDAQIAMGAKAGNKPFVLGPNVGGTDASYLSGSGINVAQWEAVINATKSYFASKGATVVGAMPFNEPDYWSGQGSPQNLHDIMTIMKADPNLQNVGRIGPSTLSSDPAAGWYGAIADVATSGSTHVLGGSADSYANFFPYVSSTGGIPSAPELHGLGEAIYAAEYGAQQGMWWGGTLRTRGQFVQASQGKQLGYAENRGRATAAAVYRAPDGTIKAFAGGFERFGSNTAYRFVSTDRDVYFDGIGPLREYMMQANAGQDSYADVQYSGNILPALDGNSWKLVNRQTGQVLQVPGGSTSNGAVLGTAVDTGATYQRWNIVKQNNGAFSGYYALFNANSGLTADVLNGSLNNNGTIDQWGNADNLIQHWFLEDAGNGYYYVRNGNSSKYLSSGTAGNVFQYDKVGNNLQQWQFVLSNPAATGSLKAQYKFEGNALDSAGTNHATVFGLPTYSTAARGQGSAINLNGTNAYVRLPSGVANSSDITISTLVKWNGGNAWQRIFDFGTGTNAYMFLTPNSGDGTMRFAITNGGNASEQILDTDPLPTGRWTQIALTLSGNTGVLYVDGKPRVAGRILLNPSDINSPLNYLGKSQFNDPLFNGSLDDFRIYDYALDQTAIASLVPFRWTGSASSSWTATAQASPKNWQLAGSAATDYVAGDAVLFTDDATNFTVNITDATVSPGSVRFVNSLSAYTLNGPGAIAGGASLTKNGNGVVTINNANAYTGGTVLNAGTLNINNASAIGTGRLTLETGTALDNTSGSAVTLTTNNPQTWDGDFAFGGTNPLNMGAGTVTMTGDRTVTVNGVTALTVGPVTGNGYQLTKAGPGNLVLTGNDTYTGATNVNAGTLAINGTLASSPTINMNTGGTLAVAGTLTNTTTNVNSGSLSISGNNTTSGNVWIGFGNGGNGNLAVNAGGTVTANVVLVGAGGTSTNVASGTGTLAAGGTINTAQWFVVGQSGAAGSSGTFTLSGGTLNVHANATAVGNLEMGTFDAANATLNIGAGSNVNLLNNALLVFGAQGNHAGTSVVNQNGGNVTFYGDNGTTIGGTGRLILASAANPTGNYTYNLNGGTLTVPRIARENTANNPTSTFNFNGGTLRAAASTDAFLQGLTTAAVQAGGAIVDTSGNSITIAQALSHDATLAAAPDGGLTKSGAGTLILAGTNTYTGGTRLTGGNLAVSADTNLGAAAGRITFAGAAPSLTFNAALNTARPVLLESGVGTLDANAFNVTVTGTITGPGSFTTRTTAGSITVNNVRIGGALTASAGTLKIAPNGTTSATSLVTGLSVTPGATLDLANDDMVVDYTGSSPLAGIIGSFKSAYNDGAWNGAGLTSSVAAAPSANGATTLAIGDNSSFGFTSFGGLPVDTTSVLIKYTWYGDLNLNGRVDTDDYALMDRSFAKGGLAGAARWADGDVNYDGQVTQSDYLLTDTAYATQNGTVLSPEFLSARESRFGDAYVQALVAAVPEPDTAGRSILAAAGVSLRRRRSLF